MICFSFYDEVVEVIDNYIVCEGYVVVICYEGFKGGLGMFEMFVLIFSIVGWGLGKDVVLIIDGCFFGVICGIVVGYIFLEVVVGGFIVFVYDGDIIMIDLLNWMLNVDVFDEVLEEWRKELLKFKVKVKIGYFVRYIVFVISVYIGGIL